MSGRSTTPCRRPSDEGRSPLTPIASPVGADCCRSSGTHIVIGCHLWHDSLLKHRRPLVAAPAHRQLRGDQSAAVLLAVDRHPDAGAGHLWALAVAAIRQSPATCAEAALGQGRGFTASFHDLCCRRTCAEGWLGGRCSPGAAQQLLRAAGLSEEHHRSHQGHDQVLRETHHAEGCPGVAAHTGAVEGEVIDEHRLAH